MRVLFLALLLLPYTAFAIPLPFEIKRDPFESLMGSSVKTPSTVSGNTRSIVAIPLIKLTGIVWDPQDPYAVIVYKSLRRIMKQGDTFDSWRIIAISAKDVTIKSQGRTLVLKIGQETRL